jgi:hypothetical protein
MREIERLGVQVVDRAEQIALASLGVAYTDGRKGAQALLEVDAVVVATGYDPVEGLKDRFASAAPRVVVVGDAREVGGIGPAIADAHRTVLELA